MSTAERRSAASLQRRRIGHREECVVVLAVGHLLAEQLALDVMMTVEIVAGLEGNEAADANHHRAQDFVADVEVVVAVAGAVPAQDRIVGLATGMALGEPDGTV